MNIRFETTYCKPENQIKVSLENLSFPKEDSLKLVDPDANPNVMSLFKYLYAIGHSDRVMFGQENALQNKAGDNSLSFCDVYDVTEDYPSVLAFDVLAFTGVEFSAKKYNKYYTLDRMGWSKQPGVDTETLDPVTADIEAAARLARAEIMNGSIFTLSAHMPNFLHSKVRPDFLEGKSPAYGKYDYNEYTPNKVEGNLVQNLLAKRDGYDAFVRYLDIVAEFARRVEFPMIFRPLHENTGSWFWWGEKHCTPEEFKSLWHFIVEYLRDEKGVHNLLYSYSPGSENKNATEYGIRYPGDDYVDMIGVDMYDPFTENGEGKVFMDSLKHQLSILTEFSEVHHKLMAITETGLASNKPDPDCHATAMHLTGNLNKNWHSDVMERVASSNASYFLLWANFSRKGTIYTPFVDHFTEDGGRCGHEVLENFIKFYNDPRSIFASQQKEILENSVYHLV